MTINIIAKNSSAENFELMSNFDSITLYGGFSDSEQARELDVIFQTKNSTSIQSNSKFT